MNFFFDFLDTIRKIGLEYYDKYYAMYPGVVLDNNDPEKRGRVKVSMPSVFGDGVALAQWALPVSADLAGNKTGNFMPPYVGDMVDLYFENGDINFPRYKGGWWAKGELPTEFSSGYTAEGPTVRGWSFKSGQKILIDEGTGRVKFQILNGDSGGFFVLDDSSGKEAIYLTHKTGSLMQIDKTGSVVFATPTGNLIYVNEATGEVTVKSAAGATITAKESVVVSDSSGKSFINVTGNSVEITSNQDVVVTAQNVNVNAGNISLGANAGDNLTLYSKLAAIFDGHTHISPLGPVSPPFAPNTFALTENNPALSAKAKYIKAKGNA